MEEAHLLCLPEGQLSVHRAAAEHPVVLETVRCRLGLEAEGEHLVVEVRSHLGVEEAVRPEVAVAAHYPVVEVRNPIHKGVSNQTIEVYRPRSCRGNLYAITDWHEAEEYERSIHTP